MATRGRSETSQPSPLTVTSRGSMPAPGREPAGPVTSALRRGPGVMVNIPGEYSLAHRPPPRPAPWQPAPKTFSHIRPWLCLLQRARMDLNRLTLHAFPYFQSSLRRYVISVPSCHSTRCFLLSCPRLALDSVPPPILALHAPPVKPSALPVLGDGCPLGLTLRQPFPSRACPPTVPSRAPRVHRVDEALCLRPALQTTVILAATTARSRSVAVLLPPPWETMWLARIQPARPPPVPRSTANPWALYRPRLRWHRRTRACLRCTFPSLMSVIGTASASPLLTRTARPTRMGARPSHTWSSSRPLPPRSPRPTCRHPHTATPTPRYSCPHS